MRGFTAAVVGAGGVVGKHVVRALEERAFPVNELRLLATARSAGHTLDWMGEPVQISEVTPESFSGVDVAFFCAPVEVARQLAPEAVRRGAVVIDKSSAFRLDSQVPLVVPEVNPQSLAGHQGIIASPNCSTIQLVVVLEPLRQAAGLARVIVSTYQAVSGTGREAVDELEAQVRADVAGEGQSVSVYPHQIAFNVLPHCDAFRPDGYTSEEFKVVAETRKILSLPGLRVTCTAVRVPVRVGHSEAVLVETERPLAPEQARAALSAAPGVVVEDDPASYAYPLPLKAVGRDEVFVGRIRQDASSPNGLWLWVVADNLRKGAATNAVQIAELLAASGGLG
ncbi:MAG: aspartate-semialdehyde dehydrogenase [Bacillota bacterium]